MLASSAIIADMNGGLGRGKVPHEVRERVSALQDERARRFRDVTADIHLKLGANTAEFAAAIDRAGRLLGDTSAAFDKIANSFNQIKWSGSALHAAASKTGKK